MYLNYLNNLIDESMPKWSVLERNGPSGVVSDADLGFVSCNYSFDSTRL